jgi:Spy/CpxP family protein refolding chaperone
MNRSLITWLLAGALAASLSLNLRSRAEGRAAPPPADPGCAVAGCGALDAAGLALDPEQRAALQALCERFCGESGRLERAAAERQRELVAALGADAVDEPAVRRLAGEIADLRRRALDACLDGVLAVRAVLTPEQVRALCAACPDGESGCALECPTTPAGPR